MPDSLMVHLTYTPVVLAVIIFLKLILVSRIVKLRLKNRIGIGDQGNSDLEVAIRAHANLLENAPLGILLFLVSELMAVNELLVMGLAIVFCVSRFAHAFGFTTAQGGESKGRFYGTIGSWSTLAILALTLLFTLITQ